MSSGPDGIPGILLNKCASALSYPLSKFWNLSMQVGRIPPNLKLAFIIPQLKSGSSRNEPSSWRPISQTSQLIKTYERAIKKSMQTFLEENSLLNDFQYGFRQNRSCLSQLLAFYKAVLKETEEGNIMEIYLSGFPESL